MKCEKWRGLEPSTILAYRHEEVMLTYEGSVIALCDGCAWACIWDKQAWVSRAAKDFTKRKISIGKLKDAIRGIGERMTTFVSME